MNFVSQAWAQAEGAAPDTSAGLLSLIPFVLIFVVFIFYSSCRNNVGEKNNKNCWRPLKKAIR